VDRGESLVSYLAVVLLVASITGTVVIAGIGDMISGGIVRVVCQIIGGDCRADPTPGAAGAPSSPAQSTLPPSPDQSMPPTSSASITCGTGLSGNAKVNFSWKNSSQSTTIYFNNHCKKGKKITANVVYGYSDGWYQCSWTLDTHGQTKGTHRFWLPSEASVVTVLPGHPYKYRGHSCY
jgi:hypothetical protein